MQCGRCAKYWDLKMHVVLVLPAAVINQQNWKSNSRIIYSALFRKSGSDEIFVVDSSFSCQ